MQQHAAVAWLCSMDHHCPWTNTCVGLPPRFRHQTWDLRFFCGCKLLGMALGVDVGSYEVRSTWKLSFSLYTMCLWPQFHSVWSPVRWKACDISWRFLNSPWRYSLKPSLWSSLSFLHCSCTFKAQASLYSLQWHSAFITVTLIWRRRWSAKCNLDLERVDVEMNLFNRCHSNFWVLQGVAKARKTVEFFQVLLQIQLLRDTQKLRVTLVTFLHTFTQPKGSSSMTFQAWPHCMVCFPGSALVFHRTVDPKKMS